MPPLYFTDEKTGSESLRHLPQITQLFKEAELGVPGQFHGLSLWWLGFDLWPRNFTCHGYGQKQTKNRYMLFFPSCLDFIAEGDHSIPKSNGQGLAVPIIIQITKETANLLIEPDNRNSIIVNPAINAAKAEREAENKTEITLNDDRIQYNFFLEI